MGPAGRHRRAVRQAGDGSRAGVEERGLAPGTGYRKSKELRPARLPGEGGWTVALGVDRLSGPQGLENTASHIVTGLAEVHPARCLQCAVQSGLWERVVDGEVA